MARDANVEATASTSIPLAEVGWLHITDISYQGQIANQQYINLLRTDDNNAHPLPPNLPELAASHARIYDCVAGESTSQLENHLQPLFHRKPSLQPESARLSNGSLRSQWAGESLVTPEWNPLYVPCTHPPVTEQCNSLDLGPRFAMFTCKRICENRLLGESSLVTSDCTG